MNEPVADAVRSILDGHCVLTPRARPRRPLPGDRRPPERLPPDDRDRAAADARAAAGQIRRLIAAYRDKEDLIAIGAYQTGADPTVDAAIALRGEIDAFLRQPVEERSDLEEADEGLKALAAAAAASTQVPDPGPAPEDQPGLEERRHADPLSPSAIPPLHLNV